MFFLAVAVFVVRAVTRVTAWRVVYIGSTCKVEKKRERERE